MRRLIIVAGLPGTGKSTYAKRFVDEGAFIVSSDEIRFEITKDYSVILDDMTIVYEGVCKKINDIFEKDENAFVVLDSTCLTDERRNFFLDRIPLKEHISLIMLQVHDINVVLSRNKMRIKQKWVPEYVIKGMARAYHYPKNENISRYDVIEEVYVD